MESQHFGANNKLFIFGMICLVISLGLFFFSLYILPYFIWELGYQIPDFVLNLLAMYQDDYQYSSAGSKTVVWLLFFVPCVITGLICYFVTRHLDNVKFNTTPVESENSDGELQKQIKESASLGGKILGLMIAVVILVLLLQYFIKSTV